jgi:hypothetical protein
MESKTKRTIKAGYEYDPYFPRARLVDITVKKNADIGVTARFIPDVIRQTASQTRQIATLLKRGTLKETCRNIWQFVYEHIAYRKDEKGLEQVRSPRRTWHDRMKGVDCDCYTVFIGSLLFNLGIPFTMRITQYSPAIGWQHIYPIVPTGDHYLTMDCVTDSFNYEVPFNDKKDFTMDLQFLDGIPVGDLGGSNDGMAELGRLIARNRNKAKAPVKPPAPKPASRSKQPNGIKAKPKGIKKIANRINKINPATVLLRNGLLAAMKINQAGVAAKLRWSYLTDAQAQQRGIDSAKLQQLKKVRTKLESIFYTAGGKPDNLRKAILGGKGNKDKAVNGLGYLSAADYSTDETSLSRLLGVDIYRSENLEGMQGYNAMGQLGEPATATAIAAATGVITAIAGLLKNIGELFPRKQGEMPSPEPIPKSNLPGSGNSQPGNDDAPNIPIPPVGIDTTRPVNPNNNGSGDGSGGDGGNGSGNSGSNKNGANPPPVFNLPTAPKTKEDKDDMSKDPGNNEQENRTEENKKVPAKVPDNDEPPPPPWWQAKWVKPAAISLAGLTIVYFGYKATKHKEANHKTRPVNGVDKLKKANHKMKHPKLIPQKLK